MHGRSSSTDFYRGATSNAIRPERQFAFLISQLYSELTRKRCTYMEQRHNAMRVRKIHNPTHPTTAWWSIKYLLINIISLYDRGEYMLLSIFCVYQIRGRWTDRETDAAHLSHTRSSVVVRAAARRDRLVVPCVPARAPRPSRAPRQPNDSLSVVCKYIILFKIK